MGPFGCPRIVGLYREANVCYELGVCGKGLGKLFSVIVTVDSTDHKDRSW